MHVYFTVLNHNFIFLDAIGCALETLPASFTSCCSLVRVWASENNLVLLPETMSRMTALKELFVQVAWLLCRYLPHALSYRSIDQCQNNKLPFLPGSLMALEVSMCARYRITVAYTLCLSAAE